VGISFVKGAARPSNGLGWFSFSFRFVYTHARINDAHYSGKYLETNVHAREEPMRTDGWMDASRRGMVGCYVAADATLQTSFPRRESSL